MRASEDLLHYSTEPLGPITDAGHVPAHLGRFKPHGLWVSVGSAWQDWCDSEMPKWSAEHRHVSRIMLAPDANILRLANARDIDAFTERYGCRPAWLTGDPLETEKVFGNARHFWEIDWPRVQSEYEGIIIAPYVYSRRHGFRWYYGWDCASGCIWKARAIASVEPLTSVVTI